jgi:glutamyl-tRNA synthetase
VSDSVRDETPTRPVRVRFAPSPTGYLHIGGVRTALFNWLLARRRGGAFVLRIDDTDAKRNVAEALEPILDGFRWLGIDWDEGPGVGGPHAPYFQSERQPLHQRAVESLIERGYAYRDYSTSEEIQAERAEAGTDGRQYVPSRRWTANSDDDRARFEADGRSAVVRLAMPRDGVCRFRDAVRGEVEFEWAREADHVIQRADGSCLYHLASVVDDAEMAITHVVRAEEHLSNTPRQIRIFEGLEADPPTFAHLPVVAEPGSRVKLSKRKLQKYLRNPEFAALYEHGRRVAERLGLESSAETFNPVIVDFYRTAGFLPEAILNYLLLLGWSLDDKTEFFTAEERIASFTLERVGKSPASFDPQKLMTFQERYMQELDPSERTDLVLPFLQRAGWISTPHTEKEQRRVLLIQNAAGDRIKLAGDILDYQEFFVGDGDLTWDEKAFEKRIRKPHEARGLLAALRSELGTAEDFSSPSLEALFSSFVDRHEIKLGQIVHAVRVAVSGKPVGFGLFDILSILGRESVVARVGRALEQLEPESDA